MNIFDKLFRENAYGVAIRPRGSNGKFTTKYPTIFKWYADPFPVHHGDKDYLFVEIMDYHNIYGQIAVAPIVNNTIGSFVTIISEPFHMSFPNVFKFRETFYMIPETYQAKQVRLYKCLDFPFTWQLDCVLGEGIELVDHALSFDGDDLIMISYNISEPNNRKADVFLINMNKKNMIKIEPDGIYSQERAAGTVYKMEGTKYRAIQDCVKCYGDFLKLYKVLEISKDRIEEHLVKEIHANDIQFSLNLGINHIHTLNMSETYEAIDFNYRKFYPNKVFMRLWQRVIRRNRRHK